jgi:acetyl esterase/lipase
MTIACRSADGLSFKMKTVLFAILVGLAVLPRPSIAEQAQPAITHTEDVIYGRKFGMALTLDVFEPAKKNGAAVFFIASFGFYSRHEDIENFSFLYKPLLDHGYTVFAVVHGSQPRFLVPDIYADIHRAVRFVRHNASRWNVDPKKFGVEGGSAGGNLALMLGTQGKPGDPTAKDPVDRESSAVQSVACLFPSTDNLNWSKPGEDVMDFEPMREFAPAFGPEARTLEERKRQAQRDSPAYFVTSSIPPTLIIHGDADKLVPLYQAQIFDKRCKEVGALCKLIVKPGAGHGPEFGDITKALGEFILWFDEHLLGVKAR